VTLTPEPPARTRAGGRAVGVVALLLLALASAGAASAGAAPRTTRPSPTVNMYIVLTDKALSVKSYARSGRTASGPLRRVRSDRVSRGDVLNVQIRNTGAVSRTFSLFGFVRRVRPGAHAHLFAAAFTSGDYVYGVTNQPGRAFKRSLRVIEIGPD
jgi:hypothetical protein